ncbi:MAG TPA: VOC family protein [Pyrinomonadaceae bacterium]|jgi:predicted enzyme related to lactoylglutathione lyase|nr:VOC family protein [Pyrinomonadaceae bacterium]
MAQEASEMAGWPTPSHGEFVWTEIACADADKAQAFYENVFGWTFKHGNAAPGMDYREFSTGSDKPVGGLYQIDPAWFGDNPPPAHWMIYVAVDDVDANAELAESLGATVHKKMDIPNVGRMAIIQDPTGAMIATFKPQT